MSLARLAIVHTSLPTPAGGLVKDRVNAVQRVAPVSQNVAMKELSFRIQVLRRAIAMHLRDEGIQHANAMTTLNECICQMRANKTSTASN